MNIDINPFNITLTASKVQVYIDDFQFGSHITLKLMLFDDLNNYLISYFVKIEGQTYLDMTAAPNSDEFIKTYVENTLGLTFIVPTNPVP